jgi:hypothetical protein
MGDDPFVNPLQDVGIGLKIGNINVNNTGCADDIALLSTQLSDAQIMVNMVLDFANLEGYELQPKTSVAIHIRGNNKQCKTIGNDRICFNIHFWKSSSYSRGFEDGNNSSIP